MSTVLYMPAFNTAPHGPAFTSVNGRSSLSPTDEQRPPVVAKSSTWSPPARDQDTSNHSPRSDSSASTVSSGDRSPENANKRRRSTSVEESVARRSPDEAVASSRRLPHPYQPVNRDTLSAMEAPQQRSLPPLGRLDVERRWQTEPRELPHTGHQHHVEHLERRPTEPVRSSLGSIVELEQDDTSATEVTRAGVQVELKKRKRVSDSNPLHLLIFLTFRSSSPTEPKLDVAHAEGGRRSAMKPNPSVSYHHVNPAQHLTCKQATTAREAASSVKAMPTRYLGQKTELPKPRRHCKLRRGSPPYQHVPAVASLTFRTALPVPLKLRTRHQRFVRQVVWTASPGTTGLSQRQRHRHQFEHLTLQRPHRRLPYRTHNPAQISTRGI